MVFKKNITRKPACLNGFFLRARVPYECTNVILILVMLSGFFLQYEYVNF